MAMDPDLQGRRVLVTRGAKGVGKAVVDLGASCEAIEVANLIAFLASGEPRRSPERSTSSMGGTIPTV